MMISVRWMPIYSLTGKALTYHAIPKTACLARIGETLEPQFLALLAHNNHDDYIPRYTRLATVPLPFQ